MIHTGIKTVATLLAALMSFYLGCFAYRLIAHALYFLCVMSMILLHLAGVHLKLFEFLVAGTDILRNADYLMYGAGALAAAIAVALTPRLIEFPLRKKAGTLIVAAVPMLFAAALVADLHYAISPVSELAYGKREYNGGDPGVEHRLTVENLVRLEPVQWGMRAEIEGTLEYDGRMKRFVLSSPAAPRHTVYVFFYQHRRTLFSEMRIKDKPRYYETVAPLLGRKVQLIGRYANGQIDADVADVREIADFTIGGDVMRPLTPLKNRK